MIVPLALCVSIIHPIGNMGLGILGRIKKK
jgi:hypothetical protein